MRDDDSLSFGPSELKKCGITIRIAKAVPRLFNRLVWHAAANVAAAARRAGGYYMLISNPFRLSRARNELA